MLTNLMNLDSQRLALLIPIIALVGIAVTFTLSVAAVQWRKAVQARLDVELKSEMLERGMSAEEIERVLRAGKNPRELRRR